MKTDREQFIDALRDEPDNLALHLVFADFLDETGETMLADSIRLQIAAEGGDQDAEKKWRQLMGRMDFVERYRVMPWSPWKWKFTLDKFSRGLLRKAVRLAIHGDEHDADMVAKWPIESVVVLSQNGGLFSSYRNPGGAATFIPNVDETNRLLVSFVRSPNSFPVNRHVTLSAVEEPTE